MAMMVSAIVIVVATAIVMVVAITIAIAIVTVTVIFSIDAIAIVADHDSRERLSVKLSLMCLHIAFYISVSGLVQIAIRCRPDCRISSSSIVEPWNHTASRNQSQSMVVDCGGV